MIITGIRKVHNLGERTYKDVSADIDMPHIMNARTTLQEVSAKVNRTRLRSTACVQSIPKITSGVKRKDF